MDTKQIQQANEMRMQWAGNDAVRDQGIAPAQNIREQKDIPYCSSASEEEKQWHLTDFYYPEKRSESYPVIVSVHGGGWFYGDKELYGLYAKYLASRGFAVVNFNYRRAPEYKYPCAFLDVCALMHFLQENAGKYRLDLSHLYMVGDSAGAQLASQYAIYATSGKYQALYLETADLKKPIPQRLALNCGIYDIDIEEEIVDWYLPETLSRDQAKGIFEMLAYLGDSFPQTYLMVSVNDSLMPRTKPMRQQLEKHHIPHIYREFGQEDKNDGHVFHLNFRSEAGQKCNEEELAFFEQKID